MTIQTFKKHFVNELSTKYSTSESQFLASVFIQEKLGLNKLEQKFSENRILINKEIDYLKTVTEELKTGKPYQHILGYCEFFGMNFFVDENVLIPRPETEEVLEFAIHTIKNSTRVEKELRIIDIGTGSGIIPIVLKKEFPKAEISAIDISAKALEIANKNALSHGVKINFLQKDYLNFVFSENWDIIISNPPYIGIEEENEIENSVKLFEPNIALFSPTSDALLFYKKIATDAEKYLKKNGYVFLEINQKFGKETLELFTNFSEKKLVQDISGNDRIVFAKK